jgi:hypothetical protein
MKIRESLVIVALCIAIAAPAIAASPKVRADYDHSANFSAYKTFAFVSPPGTEVDGYPADITQGIKSAVQREMEKRGYRLADSHADLLVNFSAGLSKKAKHDELAKQTLGYYGYRQGVQVPVYKTWSTYTYDKGTKDYVEGTINVDIVDATAAQLIWEGVAIGEVRKLNRSIAEAQPGIDRAVADIFAKYSFRASH